MLANLHGEATQLIRSRHVTLAQFPFSVFQFLFLLTHALNLHVESVEQPARFVIDGRHRVLIAHFR